MSTKIHATCDALGNPTGIYITPGQAHDLVGADVLLKHINAEALLADKSYDADARVLTKLSEKQCEADISQRATRIIKRDYDKEIYEARHLIENLFAKLKQYRAIATRYDKTARNFLGAIHLACTIVWLI